MFFGISVVFNTQHLFLNTQQLFFNLHHLVIQNNFFLIHKSGFFFWKFFPPYLYNWGSCLSAAKILAISHASTKTQFSETSMTPLMHLL